MKGRVKEIGTTALVLRLDLIKCFTNATVAEADRTDSDDTTTEALLGRLGSVANLLGALAKRMDDIATASAGVCLVDAPATGPWSPSAGLEALAAIQSGAIYVVRVSDDLLARF